MRRFEFSEGTSNKFWQITKEGSELHLQWGRIGTAGQAQTKTLGSESAAKAEHDKLVAEKTKKGYAEVATDASTPSPKKSATASPAPSPTTTASPTPSPISTSDRLAWTPELTALVDAEDARGLAAIPTGTPASLVSVIRDKCKDEKKNWELGRAKADSDGILALDSALATYATGKEPAALDADAEARVASLIQESEPLAALGAYWCARGGLQFALDSLVAMWSYYRSYDWNGWDKPKPTWVKRVDPATNWDSSVSGGKTSMTSVVAALFTAADETARANAKARAEKLRVSHPLTVRVALAIALRETAWAEEDARAVLALTGTNARDAAELTHLVADRDVLLAFTKQFPSRSPLRIVRRAGFAAVPVVAKLLDDGYTRDEAAIALTVIENAESAKALTTVLDKKTAAPIARRFFDTRPDLGIAALAATVAGKGNLATYAEPVLKGLLRAHPAIAKQSMSALEPRLRAVVERELAASAPAEDAAPSDLPGFLVTPPWSVPRAKPKSAVTIPLDILPLDAKIHWSAGAKEKAIARGDEAVTTYKSYGKAPKDLAARSKAADSFAEKCVREGKTWGMTAILHLATDECVEKILASKQSLGDPDLQYLFARFGAKALPHALARVELSGADPADLLEDVETPIAAPLFAAAFAKRKTRADAQRWLFRFAETAATGLVPKALGSAKKDRAIAQNAARAIAATHRKEVESAAARYGKPAADAIASLLDSPADEIPEKIPSLPAFVDPTSLPRPVLRRAKKALPESGLRALLTLLQISTLEDPVSLLTEVKDAFDPKSLAELAWELFQAWLMGGASSKDAWAFTSLGLLGDDECARRITPLVRAWPGESQHARAVTGLDVLAGIGTDVALMHLHGVAQKLKFKGLQEKAREKIQAIAESRGLTADELADRLVPNLGLDDNGSLVLDFGPRQFTVTFDESLKPMVKDAAGKASGDLPKPGKSDDGERAGAAVETWKALKKDAKAIAQGQVLRLEMVMCGQRRFPAESFRSFFVDHPLMIHLVRRVVWGVYDAGGKLTGTFRVAEDRSFADTKDAAFGLADDASVGLAHRLEMDDDLVARWGQVLSDYEIIQPFDQLSRAVYRATPEEAKGNLLERMKGVTVKTGKILGLEARGWRKGQPQDAGWVWDVWKALPGGIVADLAIEGGICMGYMEGTPAEQSIGGVSLRRANEWSASKELTFGKLSAAVFSELVRDIEGMRE